jgi:hypothetical protein
MENLIKKLQEKYDFRQIEDTVLKGFNNTIVLKNYVLEIEETDMLEPLRIEINQTHKENKPCDIVKVSIVNCGESDEPYTLFWTEDYNRIDKLISAILE